MSIVFVLADRCALPGLLPGDITFSNGNFTSVALIATMLLLNLLLIILNAILRP